MAWSVAVASVACSIEQGETEAHAVGGLGEPTLELAPFMVFDAGDSGAAFSSEVGRAARLTGGGYAVVDWGARTVFVFDSAGRLLRRLGRAGAGPGEYQAPLLGGRAGGDTLVIYDSSLRRVTWLDAAGGGFRSMVMPPEHGKSGRPLVGVLDNGLLLVRDEIYESESGVPTPDVLVRLYSMDSIGREVKEVLRRPAMLPVDEGGYRFYSPYFHAMTNGRVIAFGNSDRWEIEVVDVDGNSVGTLRRPQEPRAVSAADRERVRAAYARLRADPGLTADGRFAKTVPAFGGLFPGPDGTVWAVDYFAPYDYPDSVSVFSDSGSLLATLLLPTRFRLSEVGRDYLVGIGRDEDDVPHVQVHHLRWTAALPTGNGRP